MKTIIKGIGINAHSPRLDGDLTVLERDLAFFEKCGFDYVEIPVHGVDAIIGGRLNERQVRRLQALLTRFDLKYTVHAPDPLNFFDVERLELHKAVFRACLDFTQAIGGEVLVYHSGAITPLNEKVDLSIAELKAIEREAIIQMAEETTIPIGIENLFEGSYSMAIDELVEQVRAIDHSNVGITLDFGHAYLAARHHGYDFLEAIKKAAPYIVHTHIHDNFGRWVELPLGVPYIDICFLGLNDLHLPPGWGEIPYEQVFSSLSTPPMVLLLELEPRYEDVMGDALQEVRRLARMTPCR